MKFIHIADIHLGVAPEAGKLYSEKRPKEIWDTFKSILEICEEEKTDLLLIAGDLFHRQPLLRELKEVDYLFSRLTHTKVVLIAGNHDYIRKDSYYRTFSWNENVFTLFNNEIGTVVFPELETAVYGLSYHEKEIKESLYDGLQPKKLAKYEILLGHGGDEQHIPIRRSTFTGTEFDYIALGHIHRQQDIVPNHIIYAGSMEPTDKNDTGHHGFVRGEITEAGVRAVFVPYAKREYLHLVLPVDEKTTLHSLQDLISEVILKRGRQHMYRFLLRGERAMELEFPVEMKENYDNVLEIVDETEPALDMDRIYTENRNNLIGKYMEMFDYCEKDSVEYQALYEGLLALLK